MTCDVFLFVLFCFLLFFILQYLLVLFVTWPSLLTLSLGVCECLIGVDKHERAFTMERTLRRRWVEEEDVFELLHVEVIVWLYLCIEFLALLFFHFFDFQIRPHHSKRVEDRGYQCVEIHPLTPGPPPHPHITPSSIPFVVSYIVFSYPHLFNSLCFCRNFMISLGNLTRTFFHLFL